MNLMRTASAVVLLALALPISAHEYAAHEYSELRRSHDSIDAAVQGMPDSGIQGALNRVSATLDRAKVRDLPAGSSASLPANFERNLADAIDRLREEYVTGYAQLPAGDQYILLQVIDYVAFDRTLALYADGAWTPCNPPGSSCGNPAPLEALDRLAQALIPSFVAVVNAYSAATGGDPLYPPAPMLLPDDMVNGQTMPGLVDELRGTYGAVIGAESIDG